MEVGYKALSSVLGKWDPKLLESHSHVYHIKMQEYMKIRRGEAMLVLSLIREHFPEFDKLSGQTQIMILKNFAFRVLFMQRAEMTIKTFPDQTKEIKQMIIHPGCVVDGRRIELFVGEETIQCFDDQKRKEFIKHFYSIFEKHAKMTMEQYRPLEISPPEFAAMIGIQLWNCVERYAPQIDLISEKRNQLYSELLSVLAQRLGSDSAAIGVRYGRIMGLIQNITIHLHDLEEINTLLKIFMPMPFSDIWDELKNDKHFKNKEMLPIEVEKGNEFFPNF
uniref:NR LBD domain-containing protein n=1 Tax=Meloidogyne incognita TaxID=6306 RepID=A0A914L2C1_MELIC